MNDMRVYDKRLFWTGSFNRKVYSCFGHASHCQYEVGKHCTCNQEKLQHSVKHHEACNRTDGSVLRVSIQGRERMLNLRRAQDIALRWAGIWNTTHDTGGDVSDGKVRSGLNGLNVGTRTFGASYVDAYQSMSDAENIEFAYSPHVMYRIKEFPVWCGTNIRYCGAVTWRVYHLQGGRGAGEGS
eukprot:581268-Pyramimonas_sp.AAC.1